MVSKGFAKPDSQHTRFFAVLQEMQQWNIPQSEQSYETEMEVHLYKHDPAAAVNILYKSMTRYCILSYRGQ